MALKELIEAKTAPYSGPEDVLKGREWMLKKAVRDLSPAHLERVKPPRMGKTERKLIELLGKERAKRLLKDLRVL